MFEEVILMTGRSLAMFAALLLVFIFIPGTALGTGVTLSLTPNSGLAGTSITASGSADPDTWISVKIIDSQENIVLFDGVKANAEGVYSCVFTVPDAPVGTDSMGIDRSGCGSKISRC